MTHDLAVYKLVTCGRGKGAMTTFAARIIWPVAALPPPPFAIVAPWDILYLLWDLLLTSKLSSVAAVTHMLVPKTPLPVVVCYAGTGPGPHLA
jgi:hypothetical protein